MNDRRLPRSALLLTIVLASWMLTAGLFAQATPVQVQRDAALTGATDDFLQRWLVQREPGPAVDKYLSPLVNDERLLPADAFSLAEYQERFVGERSLRPHPIDSVAAKRRMTAYLQAQVAAAPPQPLSQRFLPWTNDAIARAGLTGRQRTSGVRQLNPLALTYSVRAWSDVAWTNTGAIGWELLLPEIIERNRLDARAVIFRFASPGISPPREHLMFMLWVTTDGASNWQFFGVELPPSN